MLARMWRESCFSLLMWECHVVHEKAVWRFFRNLKIANYSSIPLLGIYPKKMKSEYERLMCKSIFINIQLTIPKIGNRSRWPSTDEWILKMWYIYIIEYYSAMKKNEVLTFVIQWMHMWWVCKKKVPCAFPDLWQITYRT